MIKTAEQKARHAADMRKLRADQRAGRKPKRSRPGRPLKQKSRYALNPDDWERLAMAYAEGHAKRLRWKFDSLPPLVKGDANRFPARGFSQRQRDWEEMAQNFRIAAWQELDLICARAPKGLRSPKAFVLHGLQQRLRPIFADICARHVWGAKYQPGSRTLPSRLDGFTPVPSLFDSPEPSA